MPSSYMKPVCPCLATTTTTTTTKHTHTHNKVCLTKFQACRLILNHVFIYRFLYRLYIVFIYRFSTRG